MTVFLQVFVIAGACYVGVFAREQLMRSYRRYQRRREWRALDTAATRRAESQTPPHAA